MSFAFRTDAVSSSDWISADCSALYMLEDAPIEHILTQARAWATQRTCLSR